MRRLPLLLALAALGLASQAKAEELNLYSSRHYDTDEKLYGDFTKETGITINRIEAEADELIERIRLEGANSPADVLITVDAGRLWRAEEAGLFQPVDSAVLKERLPEDLRDPKGEWFGLSKRARVIFYDKATIDPKLVRTYEDLARPELKGKVCMRSSANAYNLSLMASLIAADGYDAATEWAKGVVANFAKPPEGNDTSQLKSVAAGECGVTLANTYYFARMMASDDPADQAVVDKVGVVFPNQDGPNQDGRGTHVNISGAGVLKHAPDRDAAVRFLEYLTSPSAQRYFALDNHEYPAAKGLDIKDTALDRLGAFKAEPVDVPALGENQPLAQVAFDEAGWR
ncbi:MAG: Fe(3+) ABC transporter substrate-binding protein [Geminicoccaceae bacterium]|nr:Fe(3+) ABC transporter substrate-binding protein [Geminicoccaceae bacterium]